MIRPAKFFSNPDTSADNSFQQYSDDDLTLVAQQEFDNAVNLLRAAGIRVLVIQDDIDPLTPDSLFPNNRLSFHPHGKVVIYPMMAANRRKERQLKTVSFLEENYAVLIKSRIDYSHFEKQGKFLEGTGSMILDRKYKLAYVAKSKRSDPELVEIFSKEMDYNSIVFDAGVATNNGFNAIYHTNVMLAIAEDFVVVAKDAIALKHRDLVMKSLQKSNREIIQISNQQMNNFCGNILQLCSEEGEKIIVMSESAYNNFSPQQIKSMLQKNTIVKIPLAVIEKASGGSIRCMMAEIF
jgi:hypothetical protein